MNNNKDKNTEKTEKKEYKSLQDRMRDLPLDDRFDLIEDLRYKDKSLADEPNKNKNMNMVKEDYVI